MSGADLSGGSAVRLSAHPAEVGSRAAPADTSAPSGFPELLTRMAAASRHVSSRPAISIGEHRPAWGEEMSAAVVAPDAADVGDAPVLATLLGSESESATDTEEQPSTPRLTPAAPALATPFIAMPGEASGASLLAAAMYMPPVACTGATEGAREGGDGFVLQQVPTADAPPPRDWRAGGTSLIQDTPEKPNAFAVPQLLNAAATLPKDAPRDPRAAVAGGVRAGGLVSVLAQETHIAPAVLPPAQGVRDPAGRAMIAHEVPAPGQDVEQDGGQDWEPAEVQLLPRRIAPLATGKPPGPVSEPLSSVPRAHSEQSAPRNADGEVANIAPLVDRAAAGAANEAPRVPSAVVPPAHQIAGQIVAAARAVQREDTPLTDILAPKVTSPPVVKILRLELQPADLGTITIRLSLKQDALDIRVEASRHDTARMLQRDQDALAKLLTTAGYRIDGVAVVAAPADGAAVPDGRSQAFLPSSQHGPSPQPDSKSSGGRPNAEPDPRTSRGSHNDDNDRRRIARAVGGDIYV